MNRLVYLYELDSVRNSPEEILEGQKAAFTEIVKNGNRIVLSFNQLTDSLAFLAAVKNPQSYPHIMRLFEEGALKVSRYGKMRTASQYIQQSIEKCLQKDEDSFIFSGLPICSSDKVLLEKLHCALKYSDPSILEDIIDDVKNKKKNSKAAEKEKLQKKLDNLEYILRYTRMILMLSVEKTSSNPPKKIQSRSFPEFIDIVLECLPEISFANVEIRENIAGAIEKLQEIREYFGQTDPEGKLKKNRTNWIHQLYQYEESVPLHLAESILHLSYNYTIEDSISDISKRYDDMEFQKTFCTDLKSRLEEYWTKSREVLHNTDTETDIMSFEGELPDWSVAARVSVYSHDDIEQEKVYHVGSVRERHCWFRHVLKNYIKVILIASGHILVFCGVDMLINLLQDASKDMAAGLYLSEIFATILSVIIFGLVSSAISLLFKLPDILECIRNIVVGIRDLVVIARTRDTI